MAEFAATTALSQGLQGCPICTSVLSAESTHCGGCGASLHAGWAHSMQHTWAWLITAAMLYIPANFLPITHTVHLGRETEATILGGVAILWEHGDKPIAAVIFIASVLVPLGKMLALGWMCLSVHLGSTFALHQKTRLYRAMEFSGRWSMIDVFVVGILVALVQVGNILTIRPGVAAIAFAAVVATTMLASHAFDPRLLWAAADQNNRQ